MLAASDPLVLVLDRYATGGQLNRRNAAVPLSVALTRRWDFDAHVVQYTPSDPPVRWNEEHVSEHPYRIDLALFDFDQHDETQTPEQIQRWSEAALAKLPLGFQGYRTSGGFRALTLLPEPHVVCDAESWNAWHAFSAGLGAALSAALGVESDTSCTDPGRIFRLPNVRRKDKATGKTKPRFPQLYGTLGVSTLAPIPVEPRAALERPNDPNASGGDTLLGALFAAAGLVQGKQGAKLVVTCPWAAEHNGGDTSGTVVMPDPDGLGLGKFHCAHGNTCGKAKDRFTWAALVELLKFEACRIEARHWPEPSLHDAYARVAEAGPMPKWAVGCGAPESDPESDPDPEAPADPFAEWEGVPIDERSRAVMLATRVPRRETGDWSAPRQEPNWTCKDLLLCPEARAHIVVAYPNGGKTWFVTELARAVSTGTPFGKRFPTRKGRVLALEFEEDRQEHNEKRQMLSLPVASPLASSDWIVLHTGDPELAALTDWDAVFGVQRSRDGGVRFVDHDADLAPLVQLIDGFDLVTIDSLRSVSGSFDENTKFASRPLQRFRRAAQLCRHSFPTILFVHHASKTSLKGEIRRSQRGQPSKDFRGLTSGTTALEGDAGNIWLLDPDLSEDFLTHVHHARKSRGPKQPSFAVRQTYGSTEPADPLDLALPVTHYQIEHDEGESSPGAVGRAVTDADVIREVLRYLYRARATHDSECRSLKAMTPSVVAQLDPLRGSAESRELCPMKPAALGKQIEQVVRANEGRLCVSQHEPGALEGRALLGTLRLRAGSSRPGWWLELEAVSSADTSKADAALTCSKARPGSAETRADALLAELSEFGVEDLGEPLGLMPLPPEYARPRNQLSPACKGALKLLKAQGVHVVRVPSGRSVLVDLAVVLHKPWFVQGMKQAS